MEDITSKDISFTAWAKQKYELYPEILNHMKSSSDPLERAIAIRIMKTAGVDHL